MRVAAAALQCRRGTTCTQQQPRYDAGQALRVVATLQLLTLVFGVNNYKDYVMIFLGCYLMLCKRHYSIAGVAGYKQGLVGARELPQLLGLEFALAV